MSAFGKLSSCITGHDLHGNTQNAYAGKDRQTDRHTHTHTHTESDRQIACCKVAIQSACSGKAYTMSLKELVF